MNKSGTQTTYAKNAQLSQNKKSLIITDDHGNKMILNANLAKFHLEIPYTKKNGTTVTLEEILEKKNRSSIKYAEAIRLSNEAKSA